ncbi:MAG: pseudouridine synthase [Sodaliphilus sp.]
MEIDCLHRFDACIDGIEVPERLNNPFRYVPHRLAEMAAEQVEAAIKQHRDWEVALSQGKMLGVLVVRDAEGELGYLAAYSGNLSGIDASSYFVPAVYDLLAPDGEFKVGEAEISAMNDRIAALQASPQRAQAQQAVVEAEAAKRDAIAAYQQLMSEAKAQRDAMRQSTLSAAQARALIHESQFQKAELKRLRRHHDALIAEKRAIVDGIAQEIAALKAQRKRMSEALQERIFRLFVVSNARGERCDLMDVFADFYRSHPTLQGSAIPPAGAGECCAPKLFQYAFRHRLTSVCIAEFWWGASPVQEVRHHGHYYGACLSKCRPILSFMLKGMAVEEAHAQAPIATAEEMILYQDAWIVVANKPAGMLSVPGRLSDHSLQSVLSEATGCELKAVHRLDMSTSGIVVLAKTPLVYAYLQKEFAERRVEKCYMAWVEGEVDGDEGIIDLALRPDITDRPRQMADPKHGKRAVTRYKVVERNASGRTLVEFHPLTGRTHQLRVHASHPSGLGCPIVGDMLYGRAASRLMLHAAGITFTHPHSQARVSFSAPLPF